MSFIKKIQKYYEIRSDEMTPKLEDTINKLMTNVNFVHALPDMITVSKAAIQVGQSQNKPKMVKFNSLALSFFDAMHKKDIGLATNAADSLIKSGYGPILGLQ